MNFQRMLFPILLAAFTALPACTTDVDSPEEAVGQSEEALSVGSITASPTTVYLYGSQALGTTRVCWNGEYDDTQVKVSMDGGMKVLFAAGRSGCQSAPWIQAGSTYRFDLFYPSCACSPVQVFVKGVRVPRSCPTGSSYRCGLDRCWPNNLPCP